jgi:hypothetical protein
MQKYRAFILGPDGRVQGSVDLLCENEAGATRLPSNSSTVTTSSCGNGIARFERFNRLGKQKIGPICERLNPQFQHVKITFDRPA